MKKPEAFSKYIDVTQDGERYVEPPRMKPEALSKSIWPGTLKKYGGDDAEYKDYPIRVGIGQDFTIEGTITESGHIFKNA